MKFSFLVVLFLVITPNSGGKKKKHEKTPAALLPSVPQEVQLKEQVPAAGAAATYLEYTCSPGVGIPISPAQQPFPNFDDCSDLCDEAANCVGFDYIKITGPSDGTETIPDDACRLFQDSGIDHQHINNPDSRTYCAGEKKLIDYTCQEGGQGSDAIQNLNYPDRFECATHCDQVVDCFSFDYIEHDDQESCRLFGHQTIVNTEQISIRVFCKNEQRVVAEDTEITSQEEVVQIPLLVVDSSISTIEENESEIQSIIDEKTVSDLVVEKKIEEKSITSTKKSGGNEDKEKNEIIDQQLKLEASTIKNTNTKQSVTNEEEGMKENVGAAAAMTFISITSFVLFGGVVFKMWIKNQQKRGAGVSLLGEDEI